MKTTRITRCAACRLPTGWGRAPQQRRLHQAAHKAPSWHAAARRPAEETQGLGRNDQAGGGRHEGGSVPEGPEAAADGVCVSACPSLCFPLSFLQTPSKFFLSCLNKAPLSLERSASASIIGGTEGSTNTRRIDPLADLPEATEKNAREVREEQEEAER